jgi:DnaJ-class molecular chaperone
LPIWDAIIGNKIIIKTLDKKELEVTIQPGTQHDQVFGIQDAGMPNMNDPRFKGRLLLKIKFVIPNNLTDQQKELIRQAIA